MENNTKKILGLDLGTNSIGWALIQQNFDEKYGEILGLGSRIIPMSQAIIGDFEKGNSISQTAERTKLRSTRRLRERHLLRRERLHRVLNILEFLPTHYAAKIDFEKRLGKFLPETETKLVYDDNGRFIFMKSFNEMLADFQRHQPALVADGKKVPYDWTIYYLRKKALTHKIEKEELAWLLLHFNQKRGYYQLRKEEEDAPKDNVEILSMKISNVRKGEKDKKYNKYWYVIDFENGWSYTASFYSSIESWINQVRDFTITTEILKDGSIKRKINSLPTFDEIDIMPENIKKKFYAKIKLKTENEIERSNNTVGIYIYNTLLQKPEQKIIGKLVRTIERNYYKDEIKQILQKQIELNNTLQDQNLYQQCIEELYPHNHFHQSSLANKGFEHLLIEDILYYQRPLRSQKGSIANCPLEARTYIHDGVKKREPLKCIPKSHPQFQEFRLWQWIKNLRIINKLTDVDETSKCLPSTESIYELFNFLNERKEIDQKTLLKKLIPKESRYRWNYVEDKKYPCNETHAMIAGRLDKIANVAVDFLTKEKEEQLWHIIYSVTDKVDYEKALKSFALKNNIDVTGFFEAFKKFPPFPATYGSYSAKAIKKLLPLMRLGTHWSAAAIDDKTKNRIEKILNAEYDENIKERVRDKAIALTEISHFQGLPEWLAKYVVYDRHSEGSNAGKWKSVADLEEYIKSFRQHSLKNPIVEQVLTETLRVVKDIWEYYGNGEENFFDEIHIELGRDMKNPAGVREEMNKRNTINENTSLRIKALLIELLNDANIENVRPYSPAQQEILKIYEDAILNDDIEIPEDIAKISKMSQPTSNELQRYKLWLEQKYRSPYTGNIIPLNKLFTPAYEIEHIIPQSRYFDDSFTNKVICESAVNKLKDNQTGLQFIQNHHGQIVSLGFGKNTAIFNEEDYTEFVKQHYQKSYAKKVKLLSLDIPEKMIERQLNDTRYISKYITHILSNIVRENKNDDGVNSKNILSTNGQITSKLKQDWGLDAVWNELILPRFERLNTITNSTHFTVYNERYQKYLPVVPLEFQKGYKKKRIDHRHHAMDALVIACATRNHINYLNNQNALDKKKSKNEKQKDRHDLKVLLCEKKFNDGSAENYNWIFKEPWKTFVPDAKNKLAEIIVSFKQNLRIINKTTNYHQQYIDDKKEIAKQTQGIYWAIRKPLHKDTVSGLVSLKKTKNIPLASAINEPQNIVDKEIKKYIHDLRTKGYDKNKLIKHFKESNNRLNEKDISKIDIYYWDNENVASRTSLDVSFTKSRIESITDTGIQKILLQHLEQNENNPELAFSPEGVEEMNKNIVSLNNGKSHQPILKVRTYETKGNKFRVGQTGNKTRKYVEAAKGTNLFFAIYVDDNGKRNFETIPLNIVIERQKQGLAGISESNKQGHKLSFHLSPNDLVYIPEEEEKSLPVHSSFATGLNPYKIYKLTDCSETIANFIPFYTSDLIFNMKKTEQAKNGVSYEIQNEFGLGSPQSKNQRSIEGIMIKENCWKIVINRIGHVKSILK